MKKAGRLLYLAGEVVELVVAIRVVLVMAAIEVDASLELPAVLILRGPRPVPGRSGRPGAVVLPATDGSPVNCRGRGPPAVRKMRIAVELLDDLVVARGMGFVFVFGFCLWLRHFCFGLRSPPQRRGAQLVSGRLGRHQFPPLVRCSASSAPSMLKLPGFWLGGNSLKVPRNCPTNCCAGTMTNRCSTRQRS